MSVYLLRLQSKALALVLPGGKDVYVVLAMC
jgi:hypothetical protein